MNKKNINMSRKNNMLDLITQMGKSIKDSAIIIIDITAKPSSTLSIIIVPKAEEKFMLFFCAIK